MRSTFMGLETSKRGLFTQQTALYTTGHNISNANTLGFSRQRVNMQATQGFPYPGLNSPTYPGHLGTGVETGSIQRIRDEFVDRQFRQETNKLGYYESRTKAIYQMEDVMNEPSEYGLNQAFNDFWQSIQDVSDKPADLASRRVAISRAEHLAESFRYMNKQLTTIQGNLGNEIDVSTKQINSLLKQIAAINKQVQEVEPSGYVPNDLYDARDVLIDKLNEYIPVTVQRVPSGGLASSVAEGSLTITFNGEKLVDGKDFAQLKATGVNGNPVNGDSTTNVFAQLETTGIKTLEEHDAGNLLTTVLVDQAGMEPSKGKLLSLINTFGYQNAGGQTQGYYPETLAKLDQLANEFARAFNEIHQQGWTLEEKNTDGTTKTPSQKGTNFFIEGAGAAGIDVVADFKTNANLLAVSTGQSEEGNGKHAITLANMQFNKLVGLDNATVQSFYQAITGKLAVDGQEAANLFKTSGDLHLSIAESRASVSSVSLDEEMTNMITFQQAYNANARMITVVDETLDKIINGMGRVGL
ncbi:flagellar hook-associated protein FlgK [Lysinibacillus sp. NPDC096418]|uniref:flagellar hook-associated protein FlgK n=1 Tax=Lysinibacillus sp. NPDC096418 TaxID=3364138 RepID=UPI00381563D6